MTSKFPELQKNDLYIAGESYAGIYVPRLVECIDWYIGNCTANKSCPFIPNLKGFIVGNGVTDYRYDMKKKYYLDMAFWYGLIATKLWQDLMDNQCWLDVPPNQCNEWLGWVNGNTTNVNIYDVFGKCWPTTSPSSILKTPGNEAEKKLKTTFTAFEYTPFIKSTLYTLRSDDQPAKLVPECAYTAPLIQYMNNDTVRTALHIPASLPAWEFCSD
jgi:hypothetical protein